MSNLLSGKVFRGLSKNNKLQVEHSPLVISFGDGRVSKQNGLISLNFRINGLNFDDQFLIVPDSNESILGMPFILKFNISLITDDQGYHVLSKNRILKSFSNKTAINNIVSAEYLNNQSNFETLDVMMESSLDHLDEADLSELIDENCETFPSPDEINKKISQIPVSEEEREKIKLVTSDYVNIFGSKIGELNITPVDFNLDLKRLPAVIHKIRPRNFRERLIIARILENLRKENLIQIQDRPSKWVSEVLLVNKVKKTSSEKMSKFEFLHSIDPENPVNVRLVVDLTSINNLVELENIILENLNTTFHDFRDTDFFISLDLKKAFWSMPLDDSVSDFFTFLGYDFKGNPLYFRPCRTLQGFKLTLQKFESVMKGILRDVNLKLGKIDQRIAIRSYVDDYIISVPKKRNFEVCEIYRIIFDAFKAYGVKVSMSKSNFGSKETDFVGRIFSPIGIKMQTRHIEILENLPIPKNLTDVQKALGQLNYSRRFIFGLKDALSPLYRSFGNIQEKGIDDQHVKMFADLREKVANNITLFYPDPNEPFCVFTDASFLGLAGVLGQFKNKKGTFLNANEIKDWVENENDDCEFCISDLCYKSVDNASGERSSIHFLELSAIYWSLASFRYILGKKEIILFTDSKVVKNWMLFGIKSDILKNNKIRRMLARISGLNLKIHFVDTSRNFADWLSRQASFNAEKTRKTKISVRRTRNKVYVLDEVPTDKFSTNCDSPPMVEIPNFLFHRKSFFSKNLVIDFQKNNYFLKKMTKTDKITWNDLPKEDRTLVPKNANLIKIEGVLFVESDKRLRIYLDRELARFGLFDAHDDSSHGGRKATTQKYCEFFYTPKVSNLIKNYVRSCEICTEIKTSAYSRKYFKNGSFIRVPASGDALVCYMDITHFGTLNILTCLDESSHFLVFFPLKSETSLSVQQVFLNKILPIFWNIDTLHTDNAANFNNKFFKIFLNKLGIEYRPLKPYCPQGNLCENAHYRLKNFFKLNNIKNNDILRFPNILINLFNARADSKTSISSYEKFYRRHPRAIHGLMDIIDNKWLRWSEFLESELRLAEKNHKKIKPRKVHLAIGDKVLIYLPTSSKKTFSTFSCSVLEVRGLSILVQSSVDNKEYVRHVNHVVKLVARLPELTLSKSDLDLISKNKGFKTPGDVI